LIKCSIQIIRILIPTQKYQINIKEKFNSDAKIKEWFPNFTNDEYSNFYKCFIYDDIYDDIYKLFLFIDNYKIYIKHYNKNTSLIHQLMTYINKNFIVQNYITRIMLDDNNNITCILHRPTVNNKNWEDEHKKDSQIQLVLNIKDI